MSHQYYCETCDKFIMGISWVDNEEPEGFEKPICLDCRIKQKQ